MNLTTGSKLTRVKRAPFSRDVSSIRGYRVTNEGEVYFRLWGEGFDPDDVTALLGIEPTKTELKGDPIPRHASWNVSEGKLEADVIDVYEMSSALVKRLEPVAENIVEAMKKYGLQAVLQVVLSVTSDDSKPTPAIGFESNVVSFLSAIGASIDVDTYRK